MLAADLKRWCRPDFVAPSVVDVNLEALRARGIEALFLDLDNTLVLWRCQEVRPEVAGWVERAIRAGFHLFIVSNAGRSRRVRPVARRLGIPFIVRAGKPRRRGFRSAAALLNIDPGKAAVIGDQLFTDIVGGNRAGMTTVLVTPLDLRREFLWTKCMRALERAVWKRLKRESGGRASG